MPLLGNGATPNTASPPRSGQNRQAEAGNVADNLGTCPYRFIRAPANRESSGALISKASKDRQRMAPLASCSGLSAANSGSAQSFLVAHGLERGVDRTEFPAIDVTQIARLLVA